MTQSAASAIRNAYKARESGLQFDIVLVFMGLAFLGGVKEKDAFALSYTQDQSVLRISLPYKGFVYESYIERVTGKVERLKQTGNLSQLGTDRLEGQKRGLTGKRAAAGWSSPCPPG